MRNVKIERGGFAWINGWTKKGGWWVRYALVQPGSIPKVETIGYAVFDEGHPMSYDSHEEARQYEEDKLLVKAGVMP